MEWNWMKQNKAGWNGMKQNERIYPIDMKQIERKIVWSNFELNKSFRIVIGKNEVDVKTK